MSNVPPSAQFRVELSKVLRGTVVLPNAIADYGYNWNFETNMGIGNLVALENANTNITLHPLGIQGRLAFMSDIPPTSFFINGKEVIIFRVILDVSLSTGERSAAIMFNQDGSTIQTTENWENTGWEQHLV